MKLLLSLILGLTVSATSAQANAALKFGKVEALEISKTILNTKNAGLLNWKMGDTLNFQIKVKDFAIGQMSMVFDAQTKKEYLLTQYFDFFSKKFNIQVGYDKNTAAVTSYKINGVKIPLPENQQMPEVKIVTQEEAHLEVEAGSFDCIHTVIEAENGQQTEVWFNPQELPLTGMLQTLTKIKNVDVKLELVSFAGKN
ncbi:MAG: hypothetical protein IPM57_04660 [Oligoflexia bacterium]|nr:hypothetical protein [Oligoflexia bacterium]